MPKVSIIIPTYNSARFIDRTIQSILDQTYTDWELILIDDCSPDNTRELLEMWQKKDSRIHVIFLEKNSGGPAHPKNVAIKEARGIYIAYLDHDDVWLPRKLEKQIAILEKDPEIGLISCEAEMFDANRNSVHITQTSAVPDHGVFPEILFQDFFTSNSSLVIPKKVIDALGARDENPKIGPSEDREYELRIAVAGYKFYVIHEVLFKYYLHANNTSSRLPTNAYYAEACLKYLSQYEKYHLAYRLYERFAKEYTRMGDVPNAKKYYKLALSEKPSRLSDWVMYLFLLLSGKHGLKFLLVTRNNLLYFLGKKSKFDRDQYKTQLQK